MAQVSFDREAKWEDESLLMDGATLVKERLYERVLAEEKPEYAFDCPNCGKQCLNTFRFCPSCGKALRHICSECFCYTPMAIGCV